MIKARLRGKGLGSTRELLSLPLDTNGQFVAAGDRLNCDVVLGHASCQQVLLRTGN